MKTKVIFTAALMVALSLPVQAQARPVRCQGERATIVGTKRSEVLEGTSGRDVIAGRGGGDTITGAGGNDVICGGGGDDTLFGNEGNDRINGGPRSDHFEGGPGDDVLDGGRDADEDKEWHDVLSFASSEQGVTVDAPGGTAQGDGSDELNGYFEILEGSQFDDVLDASVSEFELRGLGGNDHLIGGAPHSTLEGGPGDDILEGSDFSAAYGSTEVTYLNSSAGIQLDLIAGTATGDGQDTLIQIDHVSGSAHDDVLLGSDLGNIIDGEEGNDQLDGRGGEDWLDGGAGNDVVHGGPGPDILGDIREASPAGDDEFYGDDGDDRLYLGMGADAIDGGAGVDVLSYGARPGLVIDLSSGVITLAGDPDDRLLLVENASNVFSGDAPVTLIGDDGPNVLSGGPNDDTIQGGAGDDELRGNTGDDDIDGGDGVDLADGKTGSDRCVNAEEKISCER